MGKRTKLGIGTVMVGALAVLLLVTGWGAAIAGGIKPSASFGPTKQFSIVASGFSASDTSANCDDVTTLPAGPVLIESIDVFTGASVQLNTYLRVPNRDGSGPVWGMTRVVVPVRLSPVSGANSDGHLATKLAIREGDISLVPPGALDRDQAHPVQVCAQDEAAGVGYGYGAVISGQVGK